MNTLFTYKGIKIEVDHDATYWHRQGVQFFCPDEVDLDHPGPTGRLSAVIEQIDEQRLQRREYLKKRLGYLCELLRDGSEEHAYVDRPFVKRQVDDVFEELEELGDDF